MELFRDRPDPRPRLASRGSGPEAVAASRHAVAAVAEGRPVLCKFEELLQCLAGVQSAARLITEHQSLRAELSAANAAAAEAHETLLREELAVAAESGDPAAALGWGLSVRRPGQLRPEVIWRSILNHHSARAREASRAAGAEQTTEQPAARGHGGDFAQLIHAWTGGGAAGAAASGPEAGGRLSELPSQLEVEQWVIPQLTLLASGVPSAPLVEAGVWDMAGALRQPAGSRAVASSIDAGHPTMQRIAEHYGAAAAAEVGRVHVEIFGDGHDNPDAGGGSRIVWDERSGERTKLADVIRSMHRASASDDNHHHHRHRMIFIINEPGPPKYCAAATFSADVACCLRTGTAQSREFRQFCVAQLEKSSHGSRSRSSSTSSSTSHLRPSR